MDVFVSDEAGGDHRIEGSKSVLIKVVGCLIEIDKRDGLIHIEILGAERIDPEVMPRILKLDVKPAYLGPSANDLKRSTT
jgi:hypothetical protein